jgi:hypothetical protein
MQSLTATTSFAPMISQGDVIKLSGRRMIIDAVQGTTMMIRRPLLGHYIAWFALGLWHSIASR